MGRIFGSLSVYVVSPFGLAGPYPVGHGGAQGVGLFGAAGVLRTKFIGGVLCQGLSPSFLCPLRVDPLALYPTLPWSPSGICPEVVFSDDHMLLGRSFEGLSQVLEANCQSCWAMGGSANSVNVKAYRVEYHAAGLRVEGRWDSFLGPPPLEAGGLVMAGVPLVHGQPPLEKLCKL